MKDMNENEKQKVLIVDDSSLNRSILIDMLGDDYQIFEAENGKEAMKIIWNHGKDLALILLDLVMPEMNGFEVLEEMNRTRWMIDTIPVIVISTEKDNRSLNRAFDLGAADFIDRPFNIFSVQRRVRNALLARRVDQDNQRLIETEIYRSTRRTALLLLLVSRSDILRPSGGERRSEIVYLVTREILMELRNSPDPKKHLAENEIDDTAAAAVLCPAVGTDFLQNLPFGENDNVLTTAAKISRQIEKKKAEEEDGSDTGKTDLPFSVQAVSLAETCAEQILKGQGGKPLTFRDAVRLIWQKSEGLYDPEILDALKDLTGKLSVLIDHGRGAGSLDRYIKNVAGDRTRMVFH